MASKSAEKAYYASFWFSIGIGVNCWKAFFFFFGHCFMIFKHPLCYIWAIFYKIIYISLKYSLRTLKV